MSANLVAEITSHVAKLPSEQQQEVLDFIQLIAHKKSPQPHAPRKSLLGSLAHLGLEVTNEDIEEMRREMWRNFPREDI